MRIRCFGVHPSFSYWQIGGTDSFYRRLGTELVRQGHPVEFIHYGCEKQDMLTTPSGITIHRFCGFAEALDYLASQEGPVLVNAVRAGDRLRFIRFRRALRQRIEFHMVYSYFSETRYGRLKHFLEALIYPYRPGCICLSERLAGQARRYRNRAALLMPPVPSAYFRSIEEKNMAGKMVVTYVGRMESGKGAPEAVAILRRLARQRRVEARLFGYSFDGDRQADRLYEQVAGETGVQCQRAAHGSWEESTEQWLAEELKRTDVLLLPYRSVSSSVDTPLLLLEGMANLCCCVTRPLGDIPRVYGCSPFLIESRTVDDFVARACTLIEEGGAALLARERRRLELHRSTLEFDTPRVARRLLQILENKS